jgi:hypothetical protein
VRTAEPSKCPSVIIELDEWQAFASLLLYGIDAGLEHGIKDSSDASELD